MGANTKYKDSMFSLLFSEPNTLRELYCALEGVTLPPDVKITINTLQDVLFMDRVNDISFEIGGKQVILIEHQSTINPNMALRLLMYIARVYEKIIGDKSIYTSKLIRLCRPEFFVLYNGKAAYPDETIIKLSQAYEDSELMGETGKKEKALELVVKVVNINQGRNEEIAQRCRTLAEYSAFVQKVRGYEKESGNLEEAIRKAVRYCCENNILKDFLEKNASEVMNMLMTEWNWDDALTVRYREGLERAARNALAQGIPIDMIKTITGLDEETIKNLQATTLP
jgi:hypothetical protein